MIEIIGLTILAFMIAEWFQPIQWVKDKMKLYQWKLTSWLYCTKCVGFWFGLIMTQNIYQAAIISLLAYVLRFLTIFITNKMLYEK